MVIKQGYDQPPGLGAQQRYDNSTAAVQQGYEQNGQLPQVKKQSYELLSSAVNAFDPASKALQKEYDQPTVQQGFDPNGYYDEYVDQDPDGNIYGTYSRIDGMAHQGYETNGEGGALDAIINIAKSRLDPNVRSVLLLLLIKTNTLIIVKANTDWKLRLESISNILI